MIHCKYNELMFIMQCFWWFYIEDAGGESFQLPASSFELRAFFTVHCSLFTVHCSLFTVYCSLFTVYCSLFTVHCSLFTVHCSLFTVHCLPFTVHRSLFTDKKRQKDSVLVSLCLKLWMLFRSLIFSQENFHVLIHGIDAGNTKLFHQHVGHVRG